jgi:predicted outer membrane repeat protein
MRRSLLPPSEIINCYNPRTQSGVRRALTFENFKSVTLDGLWIQGFRNHKDGGAMYADNSTLILRNCWFEGNSALLAGSGGALYAKNSKIIIDGTVFQSQKTHNYGGAITTIASDLEISRSVFAGLDYLCVLMAHLIFKQQLDATIALCNIL